MTQQEIENHIQNLEDAVSTLGQKQSELCGKNEEDIRDTERKLIKANASIDEMQTALNYWLLENMKIMEKLTIKEPVSWSEQDWGG